MITRREFLKWMGVGVAGLQVPTEIIDALIKQHASFPEWKDFNPSYEYGRAADYIKTDDNFVVTFLIEHAKKYVPPKYRKNLQIKRVIGESFGRTQKIAWSYYPDQKAGYLGKTGKWIFNPNEGVFIWSKI